ncbi:hypothetical protein ARMSODRAFT_968759 [Armillaria solidipes]|uniref:Uncharacterized protein n=1 Tax=Armillaria solidipes TaxID=1076256 RepID=A0A2H3CHM0_9AGAR|nr:hypothetical protein ARMSODRAFT_968759 [Armillaria solidipes]
MSTHGNDLFPHWREKVGRPSIGSVDDMFGADIAAWTILSWILSGIEWWGPGCREDDTRKMHRDGLTLQSRILQTLQTPTTRGPILQTTTRHSSKFFMARGRLEFQIQEDVTATVASTLTIITLDGGTTFSNTHISKVWRLYDQLKPSVEDALNHLSTGML